MRAPRLPCEWSTLPSHSFSGARVLDRLHDKTARLITEPFILACSGRQSFPSPRLLGAQRGERNILEKLVLVDLKSDFFDSHNPGTKAYSRGLYVVSLFLNILSCFPVVMKFSRVRSRQCSPFPSFRLFWEASVFLHFDMKLVRSVCHKPACHSYETTDHLIKWYKLAVPMLVRLCLCLTTLGLSFFTAFI